MVVPGRKSIDSAHWFLPKTEEKQNGLTSYNFNHSKQLYSIYTGLNRSYLRSVYIIITTRRCQTKQIAECRLESQCDMDRH